MTDPRGVLAELGFTVLGEVPDVHGVTPGQAFRLVISGSAEPTERVVEHTEQAWLARARETGVVAADGTCLLMISGPGAFERPWVHVRLPDEPFLDRLRERTGQLDFVAIAASGSPVLGLTEEEWDNWIVVVDPARAAAARTVDSFADHLIASGLATEDTLIGCTVAEVDELRASQYLDALPVQYEEFLLRMGKRAGELLLGTDLHHPLLVELADELLALVCEFGLVLAPGSVIVANHGAYQLYWTEPDGTTHLGEENKDNPTHTWPSLVDCLRWEADRQLEAREYLRRSHEARLAAGQPTDSRGCR